MKILAAADIHGDSKLANELAIRAKKENVDLVVLCGDLTNFDESFEGIIGAFKKVDKKVLIIPGNHDSFATADFLAEFYGVKNIHGYSVRYEDIGFFGCGGADFGMSVISDREMFSKLKKGFDKIKYLKKKIMVSHMHSANSKSEFSGFKGSEGIRKAIDEFKPDLLLHGHIHEAEGLEETIGCTKIISVGRRGKIIEL